MPLVISADNASSRRRVVNECIYAFQQPHSRGGKTQTLNLCSQTTNVFLQTMSVMASERKSNLPGARCSHNRHLKKKKKIVMVVAAVVFVFYSSCAFVIHSRPEAGVAFCFLGKFVF